MMIRRLLPQRHRILFVVAFVLLRLAIYSIFLFKFFVLMTLPQSILAYVASLAIIAGIWKLAGWYVPKHAGGSQQAGPIVHPLVGAPGQLAGGAVATAPVAAAATAPAAAPAAAPPLTPASTAPSAAPVAPTAPVPAAADVAVNIFAVPAMRVTAPVLAAEPTVVAPIAPAAPHDSAAALVAAMGSTWPTTAGPSFERPLPAWTPPAAPQFTGARA
ncbi:MAG: hypothetical protein JWN72_40 [Thermoleophilia bacterium]|nr:hypothetical protein [Thermoleophilia bacterium]